MGITINAELVEQINALVQAWNAADRRCREMFHGWEQRSMRAGLERGFYLQIAELPGTWGVLRDENIDDGETAGRTVYEAYRRGGMQAAMDTLR